MYRRFWMAGIGVALVALLGIGGIAGRGVFAQDATPTTGTGSTSAAEYQDFVSKLAANLGIADATQVDTAIKTTLKQMVDDRLTAGHISADEANAAKQAIDSGTFGGDLFELDHLAGGQDGRGGHNGKDDGNDRGTETSDNGSDQGNGGANDNDSNDNGGNATSTPTTGA